MEIVDDINLPDYDGSPSIPPDYSFTPLPGEQCIQRTPMHPRSRDNCAFTYEERGMSLTLRGCREEDGVPAFGLCSTVYGEFAPAHREKVVSVVVRLQAQIRVKVSAGIVSHSLFSKESLLWQRNDSTDVCPSLLPVSLSFPSTYHDKMHGRQHRLPPSMSITDPCRVAIVHSLNVLVRKATGSFFFRTKSVCLSACLRYRPWVRPPRPLPLSFSSIKICPEEWQEEIWGLTKMPSSKDDQLPVAKCHLFVPSVRVFSPSEIFPFHISLYSSASFLSDVAEYLKQRDVCLEKPIHIFLLRRTTVSLGNWRDVQEEVLGVGRVFESPGPVSAIEQPIENSSTLSWDGEIQCERSIEYSSFTTALVEVRDFLILSMLSPPGPLKFIPSHLYRAFPIHLVTHPCRS